MATVKIAHIADIHLRDRQYCYAARGRDFFEALKSAISAAIGEGVSAILCAGDLFDTSRPSSTTIGSRLCEVDDILKKHGIPMLTTSGNHDANCWEWLEIFSRNKDSGLISLDYSSYDVGGVKVYGMPYCDTSTLLDSIGDKPDMDILMWHGEVLEFCGFKSNDTIAMEDFPTGIQVVAMGHIHKAEYKKRSSDGLVVAYPGSTEQVSQDEDPQKSMYVYTFDDGKLSDIAKVPFVTRPVQTFVLQTELDLENCITQIKPDSLIFVSYNRDLTNAIPRINMVIGPDNILRPTMLPGAKETIDLKEDEDVLEGPVKYVEAHIEDVVSFEMASRIRDLAMACVDPNADHKNVIEAYCEKRLGGRVTL